jgi:hypothetical protein
MVIETNLGLQPLLVNLRIAINSDRDNINCFRHFFPSK